MQQQPLLLLPPCPVVRPRLLEFRQMPTKLPRYDGNAFNPITLLRDFDYGTIKRENGRTVREFEVTASSTILQETSTVLSRL